VGTGPFKFVSYQQNVVAKYTRFDGYWQKGKPYLDGVEYNLISDSTTRSMSFQRGELDMVQQMESKEAINLKDRGFDLIPPGLGTANMLAPDSTHADSPWANPKVRLAAEHAIDREAITKATGFGFYEVRTQTAQTRSYAYNSALPVRAYDKAKAKQLLTEAGYPNGFKTTLYVRSDSTMMNWLVAAATNMQEAGIDIKVEGVDLGRYTQLQQGGWNNGLFTATWWDEPDWVLSAYTALSATSIAMPGVKRPAGLQDMFEKALRAKDNADKKAQAQAIVKVLYDDVTLIPAATFWEGNFAQKYVHETGWSVPQRKSWSPADAWMSPKK
jgi:ABC-type transport system substrate-binding protein